METLITETTSKHVAICTMYTVHMKYHWTSSTLRTHLLAFHTEESKEPQLDINKIKLSIKMLII